jgi:ribose transport system substrate-binding protein
MEAPSRTTYMMNPSVTADNIETFQIWGSDFSQLMGDAATD